LDLARGVKANRVSELDGVWDVERTGGALPPLSGVRKRIAGDRGVTVAGKLPPLQFDVDGLTLRYRPPVLGLVDELEPAGDGYDGRALLFGREVGRFRMRRVLAEEALAEDLRAQLTEHLDEALALETAVGRLLDSAIVNMDDEDLRAELQEHRTQTDEHAERVRARLEALGAAPSVVREAGGVLGMLVRGVVDLTRGERTGRIARDLYAGEHLEIAGYELLARVARRAGDDETVAMAQSNLADERAMAARLDGGWDRFAELSLREQGLS
jgi:ferritin-like metal-binding protein YciE